jgi:hypothetical protein
MFMTKAIIVFNVIAVLAATALGFAFYGKRVAYDRVLARCEAAEIELAHRKADGDAKDAATVELQRQIKELTATFADSKSKLIAATDRLKSMDSAEKDKAAKQLKKEQDVAFAKSQVPAPVTISSTNDAGIVKKATVFPIVPGRNGQILASNAEFLSAEGKRVFFRFAAAGGGGFDVDNLHPGVLAHLSIDPDEAKEAQSKLDIQRAYEERLALQQAAARVAYYEKLNNDRRVADAKAAAQKAAQAQAQAETDRVKRQAENERLQAEAAKKQADAALLQAGSANNPAYNGINRTVIGTGR